MPERLYDQAKRSKDHPKSPASLAGKLLVATPKLDDTRFERAAILLCAHSDDGALGIVVNAPLSGLNLVGMLEQLEIDDHGLDDELEIFNGGPVAESRGFVIHSDEQSSDDDIVVPGGFALSSSLDTLKRIAEGKGPRHHLVALGYAGWGAGQLEDELAQASWNLVEADFSLVFHLDRQTVWEAAMAKLGVKDPGTLSHFVGRA